LLTLQTITGWFAISLIVPVYNHDNKKFPDVCYRSFVLLNSFFNVTLLAMHQAMPHTVEWSPKVAIVMATCCVFSVAIGRFAIKNRDTEKKLVGNAPALFEGFGPAEMLATFSFGHILGAGMILGMSNAGLL
jgi:photosystem I subunit X